MRAKKQIVLINGRECEIFYRESHSKKQDEPKIYTKDVLKVLEVLLTDTGVNYSKGITTLKTLTSWNERELGIKRLSNKIIELRKVTLKSGILTFRYLDDPLKEWRYGVIKDPLILESLEKIKETILDKLGKKI